MTALVIALTSIVAAALAALVVYRRGVRRLQVWTLTALAGQCEFCGRPANAMVRSKRGSIRHCSRHLGEAVERLRR